jgi:lysophospholipase L1-like esterase
MRTNLIWICLLGLLLAGAAHAASVSPTNPNLQYIGRWDDSTPSQPWAYAQGSTLIASFTGTSISATLAVTGGEYFRVIIDDNADASTKVSFSSGTPLSLATGLTPGTHKLELIKETDEGRATLIELEIDDGESIVPSPPRPTRRIVFYGASNLAGYSLESERNQGGSHLIGCYYGYAGITARMFGAEYQNISRSGATITSLNDSYDRIDWSSSSPTWDFASYPVDVVVVNIGANDAWRPKSLNKSRYHSLLDDLRTAHPAAHILLYNAYGWDSGEPAAYTHEVVAERTDPNLSSAIFPWVFEQYHGCQTDHAGMAETLAPVISSITGWTAGVQDVVSGFGRNGGVANGSFEEAAPFGGWGWRYFDDGGVTRVFDHSGAHHGSYYLRLENGASSHQTNPASNGDVIVPTLWLRGANNGDSVDVTVSFRDQDGGGEPNSPMASTTETMTLTTSWERYTMAVTAPTDPPDPVYSARLTLTAGFGDAVDIDLVAVGSPAEVRNVRWLDRETMTWDAELSAVEYHLYGGLVSELTCAFSGACLDDRDADREDTTLTDMDPLLAGECRFYLVTSEDAGGNEGPLGGSTCGERVGSATCP